MVGSLSGLLIIHMGAFRCGHIFKRFAHMWRHFYHKIGVLTQMLYLLSGVVKILHRQYILHAFTAKNINRMTGKAMTSQHKNVTCWKNSDGRYGAGMGCLLNNDMKRLRNKFYVALCYFVMVQCFISWWTLDFTVALNFSMRTFSWVTVRTVELTTYVWQ